MSVAAAPKEAALAPDPVRTGTGPVRVGGLVRPPMKIRHVDPVHPEIAGAARVAANVVLDCLLDVEGRVTEIRVVSGHPLLDAAAKDAVARWRYTPTYLNDTAVPVLLTVTVRFTLGEVTPHGVPRRGSGPGRLAGPPTSTTSLSRRKP